MAARRLLVAIVRRAVLDFAMYRSRKKRKQPVEYKLGVDAAGWLFFDGTETHDSEGRYTFLYICALLELDAREIREQALRLTRTDLHRFNGEGRPT